MRKGLIRVICIEAVRRDVSGPNCRTLPENQTTIRMHYKLI